MFKMTSEFFLYIIFGSKLNILALFRFSNLMGVQQLLHRNLLPFLENVKSCYENYIKEIEKNIKTADLGLKKTGSASEIVEENKKLGRPISERKEWLRKTQLFEDIDLNQYLLNELRVRKTF